MRTRIAPLIHALLASTSLAGAAAAQPTPRIEVAEASVTDLQNALTSGRATSVSLTRAYLARIAAYDQAGPQLNAIIRVNPRALADAARLDAERKAGKLRGPLHGIPVIVKDNYDTGDLPTSAGSLALANSRPVRDGFVVRRLRDAGAIVLAKANMHELAAGITNISSLGGQTLNPYDPARCPGGSSGGTGAAIAASFAAVGWGSDTCGSIRIPSAFGSLFGLRPTIGLVSRSGIVPLAHSQDIGGPLARRRGGGHGTVHVGPERGIAARRAHWRVRALFPRHRRRDRRQRARGARHHACAGRDPRGRAHDRVRYAHRQHERDQHGNEA
jgi:amidase